MRIALVCLLVLVGCAGGPSVVTDAHFLMLPHGRLQEPQLGQLWSWIEPRDGVNSISFENVDVLVLEARADTAPELATLLHGLEAELQPVGWFTWQGGTHRGKWHVFVDDAQDARSR